MKCDLGKQVFNKSHHIAVLFVNKGTASTEHGGDTEEKNTEQVESHRCPVRLLVIIIIVRNVEVAKLVCALGGSDHMNIVAELLLLQVLLGQVLQVALGERWLGGHHDLGLLTVDLDLVAEVASLAADLMRS